VSECRKKFFLFTPNIKGENIAQYHQEEIFYLNENNKFGFLS